jgi:hypothetical protein
MLKRGLMVVVTLVLVGAARADENVIYQGRDADGKAVFRDRPAAGAKPVELPPVNTVPAATPRPDAVPVESAFAGYERVLLSAPAIVPNGLVPTTVGIAVEPSLRPGHRWQLVLDGEVIAEGDTTSHTLGGLSRGPHRLSLQVVDGGGSVLGSDGPVEMFVYRPGQN